ncbi:MAG: hypothetical protein B7X34_10450 [Acidobacteriia bacterium 12-62-4]|nr:MAG: hypothetical protein B7X34_10450 [Acidobacteriia bacterium 12-62-4]
MIAAPDETAAPRSPFWGWLDVFLTLGAILPALVISGGIVLLALTLLGVKPEAKNLAMPSQLLGYAFWVGAAWLSFHLRHKQPFWESLGFGLPPQYWRFLAYGPALTVFVGFAGWALQAKEVKMPLIDELLADPVQRVLFFLFAVTFGPVCEELFFRGLVLPLAVKNFGQVAALVLTSVPFALIHGPQYSWSWQHLLLLTVAGLVFGWLRLQSGTAAATLTHCTYNLAMFGGFILNGRNY